MDIHSMLNDDAGDAKKSGSTHDTSPFVPRLQTDRSSVASSSFSQGSPAAITPGQPSSYGQPPPPSRRTTSFQSQHHHMTDASPRTPHTPNSAVANAPSGYFHQQRSSPGYINHSSSPYAKMEQCQSQPGYVATPRAYVPHAAPSASFGPSLHEPSRPMPAPRESVEAYNSRQNSPRPPPKDIHGIASPSGAQILHQHHQISQSPATNGRQSLSVSPKTISTSLPSRSREPSIRDESISSSRQDTYPPEAANTFRRPSSQVSQRAASPVFKREATPRRSATPQRQATPHQEPRGEKRERASVKSESPTSFTAPSPLAKKRRITEIPIWAQPAKRVRKLAKYLNQPNAPNGVRQAAPTTALPMQPPPSHGLPASDGAPLVDLERNIHGDFHPHNDLTRKVCDWLFQHVVFNQTLTTARVGEAAKVEGALEIEAKIGTILDRRTDERLSLPISTETLLAPNFDVGFESIMSLAQHKTFNEFLNQALKESLGAPTNAAKPRIPMKYEHKRELDLFFPLPQAEVRALPQQVQDILKLTPGRQPRVRITRDQKTGNILASVIKARIADLHILSPQTHFDYRVSINLEANWAGDVQALMASGPDPTKKEPDRYKDRVSYIHQFCQIDLTQVKPAASAPNTSASHELEVELDSSAVKEQGQRVLRKEANQYEEIVGAFLDNVRILVRAGGKVGS